MSWKIPERATVQWPAALDILIGALRSGLNIESSLNLFFEESPEPLRFYLHKKWSRIWYTMPLDRKISTLFSLPELALVKSALLMSLEGGGRQSDLLQGAARQLRSRREFSERVKALTAHARVTAWIVGLSPLVMGGIFYFFAPEIAVPLFGTEKGRWLIVTSFSFIGLGLWMVQKMSRIQL